MTVIRTIRRQFIKFQHSIYKIVDSFPLTTSKFGRAYFSKLFKGIASYGYCASKKEKYFGFKVHVVTDLEGNPYDYVLTPANVDDREPLFELVELLDINILFGDKGYIGKRLFERLFVDGIQLITKLKSNMKGALMSVSDKLLLRKRAIIETVNDELKNIAQVEHSRHRSFDNFVVNLLGGIAAYCYFPKKPTIRVQTVDISNDKQLTLF